MKLDLATVLRATGARVSRLHPDGSVTPGELSTGELSTALGTVVIDSRAAGPDDLFVALGGEHADGHDYLYDAFRRGAAAAFVSRDPAAVSGAELLAAGQRYLLHVPDTLAALQKLAAYWRSRLDPEVIGITGSIGKTTSKEILASILAARWPVLKSEANLNTEIGLPLQLLRLRPEHRLAVLEMGMYAPGDIALLARIARPRLGLVTNVAPIHLERLGSIERIARTKSELIAALPVDGLAVLNGDDPWTRAMAVASGPAPALLAGNAGDCDYRAVEVVAHGLAGTSFTILAEGERWPVRTQVPGAHTVTAFLMAAAVARHLRMEWAEITEAISAVRLRARQDILPGRAGMLIIDDSYNAAPASVTAALELLRASPGTKIAVLGDMLELGPQEEEAHRQIGQRAAGVADWLVVRGPRSSWIAEEAEKRGLADRTVRAASNAEAVAAVDEIVAGLAGRRSPNCTVLVKGSRGMKMEEVVQGLRGTE